MKSPSKQKNKRMAELKLVWTNHWHELIICFVVSMIYAGAFAQYLGENFY